MSPTMTSPFLTEPPQNHKRTLIVKISAENSVMFISHAIGQFRDNHERIIIVFVVVISSYRFYRIEP